MTAGNVRAVYTVRPQRDDLDGADIIGIKPPSLRIAVELGDACYAPSAASALADFARQGYDIDIRGTRYVAQLACDIDSLVSVRPGG